MRTIKTIVLGLLAAALVVVGIANMGAVDLYLLPPDLAGDGYGLKGIPLAIVILVAGFAGAVIGLVLEWLRAHGQRAQSAARRRELAALQGEIDQLRAQLAEKAEPLPHRPAA